MRLIWAFDLAPNDDSISQSDKWDFMEEYVDVRDLNTELARNMILNRSEGCNIHPGKF